MFLRSGFRERSFGSKVSDTQRLLQRKAGGHDFAKDLLYRSFGQWPGIGFGKTPQYLRLALRTINIALLDFTNAMSKLRTLADEAQNLPVQVIDALAQLG